ncbi:DUF3299 domain-containing protein [Vibrio sp. DW001]|uniref:DUF3299 domain-containing protein n=1 Tax=Vibrio sp. DW001 TaxID=2912315 RepID=UPI0023AF341E|nr:DUF3299 domain-containing protein [Vibrio sp. DW001]WED28090.1 DUF3299 domain-containing protein [Vibrio sp. DW001]
MKYIVFIFSIFSFSLAAETQLIDWDLLSPHVSNETIKIPEITENQRSLLASVLYLQTRKDGRSQAELRRVISVLENQGLDVTETLKAREDYMNLERLKAETINPQITGNKVRMAGFIVPIEFDGVNATEFLLVPYAGACIHLPPPPANQIVKLSYPVGFEIENVQYPVWVEGVIKADKQTDEVYLVDGKSNLTMGYTMDGSLIEKYYE